MDNFYRERPLAFRVFRETGMSVDAIVCELYARDEADALLSTSWGYSGARFERDEQGRPAMVTATDVFRAEEA